MNKKYFLILIFICISTRYAFSLYSEGAYQSMNMRALHASAALYDSQAILALGMWNDPASLPLLRQLAQNRNLTGTEIRALSETSGLLPKGNSDYLRHMAVNRQYAYFAARAVLTKMGVADYFNDFIVAISTAEPYLKLEIITDLGYIDDKRAIKYIGPMLLDNHGIRRPGASARTLGERPWRRACEALGHIIQPEFLGNREHPEYFRNEWVQWWLDNRGKYGDTSPLPPGFVPAASPQVKTLRQTK